MPHLVYRRDDDKTVHIQLNNNVACQNTYVTQIQHSLRISRIHRVDVHLSIQSQFYFFFFLIGNTFHIVTFLHGENLYN